MSTDLNPSKISMSYTDSRFKDKSGDIKILKIKFPSRATESKELEEVSLGEFISFHYPAPASEKKLLTPKEGTLLDRLSVFLYADPAKKMVKAIELKNYMLRLTDSAGKPISLSEGLNFVKNYIRLVFNQEQDVLTSLLKDPSTIGKEILIEKNQFTNPVLSTYSRFEKTFLNDLNQKQKNFSSFIRTYDISRIRNLEKVILTEDVLKEMQSMIKVSKRNGI